MRFTEKLLEEIPTWSTAASIFCGDLYLVGVTLIGKLDVRTDFVIAGLLMASPILFNTYLRPDQPDLLKIPPKEFKR